MREELSRALAAARAAGREVLLEHEGLALVAALGIGVPRHVVVRDAPAAQALDLGGFAGDRVVVKVQSPQILHKTEHGGVRIVARDAAAVAAAVREMQTRLAGHAVEGFLVAEFVGHDASLCGEVLLGMRWTPDFGPVVTFGPGGVHAEFLARNLRTGRGVAICSPSLRDAGRIERSLAATAPADLLTRPQRGRAPRVALAVLRGLVERFLDLAAEAGPAGLLEFEVNPLVFAAQGPVALDVLAKLGPPPAPPAAPRPLASIGPLLQPRSIAIVGVSRELNPGRIILRNVLAAGFPPERVFVVKPGADSVDGCRCVPDLASLPAPVDLLVVSVEASQAAASTEEAISLGRARSVILIPGGMGERSGSGGHVDRVRRALEAARTPPGRHMSPQGAGGPVVNGANCLGIRSVPGRYDTLFIPGHKLRFAKGPAAPLAVLSQSGAFAVSWASRLGSLNPRYVVTLGNQADLTVADYLEHLAEDPEIRVFACYVEGFRPLDGERWVRIVARLRAQGRAVLLYRAGRSEAGARASASHTASVAGDYEVCRALAASAGAVVAETLADFADLTRLFCALADKEVAGLRLGAMSNAGFECVAIADHAGEFTLAPFAGAARARLGEVLDAARLGAIVGVGNPLDVTPILGDAAFAECAAAILGDPCVDVGIVGCVPLSGALQTLAAGTGHTEDVRSPDSVVQRLARLRERSRKAWVAVVDAGPDYDAMAAALDAAGVPCFRNADRALWVFGRYCAWRLWGATDG